MAKLVKDGDFVGPGEERTAAYLERCLPKSWVIICNKELVALDGSVREVDFVIIGKHVVFAIEEKNWSGPIHGNDNGWVSRSGESFASPLGQVEGIARRLAGLLRGKIPELRKRVSGHFVFGRVVLSHDDVQIFVHDTRVPNQVLHLAGCDEELKRFDRLQPRDSSISPFRAKIVDALTGLPDRPKIPRRIGDYEVLEALPAAGPIRCLRAQHPDGSLRLLKLVMRPVTLDRVKREADENALLREYQALQRLAGSGRVPHVDPYFSWDQDQFWVFPIHPLDGCSLRADRTDAAPQEDRIWRVIKDAFTALNEIQEAKVIHRALSPDRISIRADGRIAFSDFIIARIQGELTVASQAAEIDPEDAYRAPECRVDPGLAEPASDVYSLAASLFFWITGYEPEPESDQFPSLASLRSDLRQNFQLLLSKIFDACLKEDERERPTAREVSTQIEQPQDVPRSGGRRPESIEIESGSIVEGQYRIIRKLGEGGTATTYLVEDEVVEELFVLKIIRNPELIAKLAHAEFRSLMYLSHPNLPRVFDIRPPECQFHLKLEYVRGSPLRDVVDQHCGRVPRCLGIGKQVLDALTYLGEKGLIHRDISPANILMPDEDTGHVTLIDFGLATSESDMSTVVGTPRYRAPEIERRGRWTPSCDLYSLGVVLFELLTGRLPYEVEEGVGRKGRPVTPSVDEERAYGSRLLKVLLKATESHPVQRFQNAAEFAEALHNSGVPEPKSGVQGNEVINPVVDSLRAAYRNSRIGNADNRGLDTEFARETYVPTHLDTHLLPRLLEGCYRLVILSGNPGDGKTAYLQRFRDALRELGGQTESEDASGWRIRFGDRTFAALYDASESHEGNSADGLVHKILEPVEGEDPPDDGYSAAIAVNDGRLLDFFERNGASRYPWLWNKLAPQLFESQSADSSVVLVDLKRRSVVGEDPLEASIFSRILEKFVEASRWAPCEGCAAREECPIRFNALSFRDPILGPVVRNQLHQLLLAVHLQRERRPTVRDLRSALAFLITHDLGCEDIHKERDAAKWPLADTSRIYSSAVFNRSGSPDLLLDDWGQLDPAVVASPRLDRFLYFNRTTEVAEEAYAKPAERVHLRIPIDPDGEDEWLRFMKRRYFFEASRDRELSHRWELPRPTTVFPYRHLSAFLDGLLGRSDYANLLKKLLEGISRADDVPRDASKGYLALRVTEATDEEMTIVKRFPSDEFRIRRSKFSGSFVESLADQFSLEHRSGSPALTVELDLFELLGRAAEGYLPGPEEQQAFMEELSSFKNQLLARPTQEVVILDGRGKLHQMRVRDGKIWHERDVP